MHLEIITPDKKVFDGEVTLIQLPGSKGSFTILNNHAPIISTLEAGTIKVQEISGKELFFKINGGVVEQLSNKLVVLVESA
ncbi:MAG TPA: ATP synthase F1 subunit epsilon [Prolixibacteraceae bacterium]|nr:ATP synthase F1 subunit epsilon [Prolixibacteraceae bacterium]